MIPVTKQDSVKKLTAISDVDERGELKYLLHMEIQAVIINVKVYTCPRLKFKFIHCTQEANLTVSDML